MHKFTQAAIATAVLSLSSYPALSEGIEPPSHTTGFSTLAGIPVHPLASTDMARTRGAFHWNLLTPGLTSKLIIGDLPRGLNTAKVVAEPISISGIDFTVVPPTP